jgi:hypothetical protein
MRFQSYILPIFISTNLIGQNTDNDFNSFDFGFSHSTYTSLTFNSGVKKQTFNREHGSNKNDLQILDIQYGFGIGLFLWMPLNKGIAYKPKIEGNFCNLYLKQNKNIFATSFDLSISQSFAILLKSPNEHGTICIAKDMSCYLTSKQPYLLIGPKINLKKFDKGFINQGFENEISMGFLFGYGIKYEFHGTCFSPEIIYSIASTNQNKIQESKKIVHSLTVVLNFF